MDVIENVQRFKCRNNVNDWNLLQWLIGACVVCCFQSGGSQLEQMEHLPGHYP